MAVFQKKLYEVQITNEGFSKNEIIVPQGKSVSFLIDTQIGRNENSDPIDILQVVSSDVEGQFRPVVGGYRNQPGQNRLSAKFKLPGDYFFKLLNHPEDPPVCRVIVKEEDVLTFLITDNGFMPRVIRIEEHTTIKWQWSQLSFPHSIYEADYDISKNEILRTTKELATKALTNSYKRTFKESGLYYFQTDSKNPDVKNMCLVEVYQSFRDRSIEILDSKFSPARLTIEEGDRVFFHWNKTNCTKKHRIYQIEPPLPDHPSDKAYFPVENGFKWSEPSYNGLVIQKFEKCGVYYFSDISGEESASYIGIVAVKQKCETHILDYDMETKSFGVDLLTMETGDTIFWRWAPPVEITVCLKDYNFLSDKKINSVRSKDPEENKALDLALSKIGVRSFKIKNAGIYYFEINTTKERCVLTVVATSAQNDHKIAITDAGAKPKILEIYPEDRVWFVWDDTRKSKNIRQVDHQNEVVPNGFLSGSLMESPGTFLESFNDLGVYHYRTDNINEILGAIVVVPEPSIQLISVSDSGLKPDPIVVSTNDIVIWAFSKPQTNGLVLIDNETDLIKYAELSHSVLPRRHFSYSFRAPGVYHFASPSFDSAVVSTDVNASKGLDNTIISTVIVDKADNHSAVIVDISGFHPNTINVELAHNVLFDWTDTNQAHNIIHIKTPTENDFNNIKVVQGPTGFNSGKPVVNKSFLHRFDKPGKYSVVSEGSPDSICTVQVLVGASKTDTPSFVNEEPFVVYRLHKILLKCKTQNASIHYTTDGSKPTQLSPVYDDDNGAILNEEGIAILRAVAYSDNCLTSDIFTSQRFYVIPAPDELNLSTQYDQTLNIQDSSQSNQDWWRCIPKISYTTVGVSCIEITWDILPENSLDLISHYQLFLNKVSYKKKLIANTNRIVVKGLAGGKNYDTVLMVYPKSSTLMSQQSNTLQIKCPILTPLGGPVISLKSTSKENQVIICWQSIDTRQAPIEQYQLVVNGERKEIIRPKPGIHKVTIESVKNNICYSIIVIAVPKNKIRDNSGDDSRNALISNEFEITLPLDIDKITLPELSQQRLGKDYYDEYMEIVEYANPIRKKVLPENDNYLFVKTNMNDCYVQADGKKHVNLNKFVVNRVKFKENSCKIVTESVEYEYRIMQALRATQFAGKPIVVEEQSPVELSCYHHTKTPNRHVNVRLLKKRESLKKNRISS